MAIYHLNVGHVSRTTGRSSVQSAAYITGEKLFESRRELKVSYANRQSDIVASQTLAPDHAPDDCRELSVWDRLESYEDDYAIKRFPYDEKARTQYMDSARTAMTVVLALPRELLAVTSLPAGHLEDKNLQKDHPLVELVEQFAKERFVSRGLIVTYAIHDDEGNPHAHLQISRRSVDGEGRFAWAKDRDICTRAGIKETRSVWAELTNRMLEREGFEARITEKSFADLGIDLEPTEHRGWVSDKLKEKGLVSRIVQENAEVYARNREKLIENPEVILDELTVHNATLTQRDILKGLQKRLGDDAKLVAQCFEQALNKAVYLGVDVSGLGRYTSVSYLKNEQAMLGLVEKLMSQPAHGAGALSSRFDGSLEQRKAAEGLLQGHQLSVMIGRAGSGKTTTLKAVADGYKKAGYTVIGTSLSALASDNLGREARIEAHTVASLTHRWQRYETAQAKFLNFNSIMTEGVLKQKQWYRDLSVFEKHQLTYKHVLIVDEAGMLGTRQWQALLQHAFDTGAKVIAVGDDHQFTAIEAGGAFRELRATSEKIGSCYQLGTIHRQKEAWMKEASRHFAELETGDGLAMYEQNGRVHASDAAHMSQDIAARYMEIASRGEDPNRGSVPSRGSVASRAPAPLVLAFTNQQVSELNQAIRALRGLRPFSDPQHLSEDLFQINGKGMAIGDVVVFTKNDRSIGEGGVYNGSRGVVKRYDGRVVTVEMNDGTTKSFNPKEYPHLDYGYAVTLHKSQGQTVDHVLVAASPHMDAKAVYVAMTRHRYDAELFYTREDFKDFRELSNRLSRFENKDMAQDYPESGLHPGSGLHTIRPENQEAWQRVQDYRLAVLDGAASLKQGDKEAYWEARSTQIKMGKEILKQGKQHTLYLHQAGLTENMLGITTGLKQRGLSLSEQKAKITVELYSEVAKEARSAWQAKVPSCNELRAERDSLAQVILENVPLHRPFFKENNVQQRALQNQVAYRQKMEAMDLTSSSRGSTTRGDPLKSQGKQGDCHTTDVVCHDSGKEKQAFPTPNATSKTYQRSPQEVVRSLNDHIKDVAYHVLGEPSHKTAKEWRYGSKGSIAIVVSGARQGLCSNFETGSSGHAIQLVADELKISRKEAFKWGANWLGGDIANQDYKLGIKRFEEKVTPCKDWVAVKPESPAPSDLKKEPGLDYMMRGRQEVARYAYRDVTGEIVGYVVRLEDKDGKKITPMLSYGYHREENVPPCNGWQWKSFASDGEKRPLYGLDVITREPEGSVLVVEGEKTCEAARKIFPEHTVITWSGGCGAIDKSDWSALKGREVTLWPDHDQPGRNAMNKIEEILQKEEAALVRQVNLPSTLPHKWDLADEMPEGMDEKELRSLASGDKGKNQEIISYVPDSGANSITLDFKKEIDDIIENEGLETALKYNENKSYQDINNLYKEFKDLSQLLESRSPSDQWHLRRAVYAVYQIKEYGVHEISQEFTNEQRFRHTLVSSALFANTGDGDVHFKAVGITRIHDRTGMDDEKSFKETFGLNPLRNVNQLDRNYPSLQEPLRQQIMPLFAEYEKEYKSHEHQKSLDRQKNWDLSR